VPSTKEIKGRMKSVSDTQKITNAMYMIASTKMRRAKAELDKTRPYFDALRTEIERVFQVDRKVQSRYFISEKSPVKEFRTYGCLVITADKGLAGAYNQNVLKEAQRLYEEYPHDKFYVVGEYGRRYFERRNIPMEHTFLYTAQNPTIRRAREISSVILEAYESGVIDDLFIIYTDLKNSVSEQVKTERLLPFPRAFFIKEKEEIQEKEFEFVPSIETVLNNCVRNFIPGYIYGALVDSFCSEQNARMEAMSAASDNAQKILDHLSLQYNHARQAAITREITEVSAGAKAQRKKKQAKADAKRGETVEHR